MSETKEPIVPTREKPVVDTKVEKLKIKKPKKLVNKKEAPVKLDLSKKEEETKTENNAVSKSESKENVSPISETPKEKREETSVGLQEVGETHTKEQTTPKESEEKVTVIQEITDEKSTEEVVEDIKDETKENPKIELPENVEKLVDFMKTTGGTVEDYVRLNADYSNIDDSALLREYYKNTKPHLNQEEVDFLLEDKFSFDEDMEGEREIRKKKLAMKEEIAKARNFLDGLKSKYYEEIKLRPGVTQQQQKAMDFFNKYNEEQEIVKNQHNQFKTKTKDYFAKDFKGFDFKLGERKFRYSVNNPDDVADQQSNLTNFVKTFLDEKGNVTDYQGYHKAIYAARNADTIASHFYEQGKADAIKDIAAKSKNISNEPRESSSGDVFINGLKVRAISGADSSKLKIKKRQF